MSHSLIAAAKRPVKDAYWNARGRTLKNPTLTRPVSSLLFVCKGNICRSPFAALRAAQRLDGCGASVIRCASAGITASASERAPQEAREAARAFGVDLDAHAPTRLTEALVERHDLIVVMEADQMQDLQRTYRAHADRIFLLPVVDPDARGGYARYNITDPFGQPLREFERCYRRIDQALEALLAQIAPAAATRNDTLTLKTTSRNGRAAERRRA